MADIAKFVQKFDPLDTTKAGGILMGLNILGMSLGALANTTGAAIDKSTTPEEKKFTVPAGVATGVANVGAYYLITDKIISHCKNIAETTNKNLEINNPTKFLDNAKKTLQNEVKRFEKGFLGTGLFKKNAEYIDSYKNLYFTNKDINQSITEAGIQRFKKLEVGGAGVVGALVGAFISCAIITPFIRDGAAYIMQRRNAKKNQNPKSPLDNNNPVVQNPTRTNIPVSMQAYMNYTKSGMKI